MTSTVTDPATTTGSAHPEARRPRGVHRDSKVAWAMLAPALILLTIFVIVPAGYAIYLSFFEWSFYQPPRFVGLHNFVAVLTDPAFRASVLLGLKFVLMTVPTGLIIAFLFASFVMTVGRRLAGVLKVSIYIPTIISSVITSIVFTIIYDYSGGLLNAVVNRFGLENQAWLGEVRLALPAIAAPAVWIGLGLTSLIMIAGMIDIPDSFYEAASLEGANWWQKTIYITIPQLKNILLFLLITGFVAAVQQYELPLVMTGGGPLESTTLPNLFIFNHFRNDPYQGYSLAAALLLFIILGTISALVFRVLNSEKLVD
ncbi:carbohydrate ABC transporter permease [Microlunatus soli]|uniref:Multiple sugar transport system permease protein n=1 Tax=Microlunatus soli TaxID=630515 RepID=A0A1H1MHQ4_9ACTN|nr:sugar ABC transporter permease [Microlunatus soli]SDR86374.1 multiple sugar transport system permease protein [Microlunatus soli]